jgi:hypothetical protein
MELTVILLLHIAAFVVVLLAAIGKARLEIAVLLVIIAMLLEHLPKG